MTISFGGSGIGSGSSLTISFGGSGIISSFIGSGSEIGSSKTSKLIVISLSSIFCGVRISPEYERVDTIINIAITTIAEFAIILLILSYLFFILFFNIIIVLNYFFMVGVPTLVGSNTNSFSYV